MEAGSLASEPAAPLLCARCSVELRPGSGEFFQITIEAVADPSGPVLLGEESSSELRDKIGRLLDGLSQLSEREAMDQVHRRLVIHLCNRCYSTWIENPAGET